MNVIDCEQGSESWKQARCGSLGASVLHEVVARTKSGWGASRANRMATLIIERLTGVPQDGYQNAAMLHGIETEPEARDAYCFYVGEDVQEIGLAYHPTLSGAHASPDGLVGDQGLLEVKCPQPAAHLSLLLGEPIPHKYIVQMMWQMACTRRIFCDFVSYNPQFPENMKLFVQRIHRDDEIITGLENDVAEFLRELDEKVKKLRQMYETSLAA